MKKITFIELDLKMLVKEWNYNIHIMFTRLRELLIAEEELYLAEMEAKEESIEDRQEKMRQRANELRAKREAERRAFVAEKLEEKFRYLLSKTWSRIKM